jgi:tetraacyldisaccharide 4'-kinase
MRTPEFWSERDYTARLASALLSPLGWAYGASVAWKRDHTVPFRPRAKTICVGNLTAGGSGKTPIASAIADALLQRGLRPMFLSRGYGGKLSGPVVADPALYCATDTGDEPLLLAATAPAIVAHDRRAGANLADTQHADVIVMDDGHQNFQLAKDLSFIVVDAETSFGNRKILPAGPLREPIAQGLARADAIVLVGDGNPSLSGWSGPVLRANLVPTDAAKFKDVRVVAFAGIGRPEKFFESLRALGAKLVAVERFDDHHAYSAAEIARLKSRARGADARLITTEKDFVRLMPSERKDIDVLPVRARFDDTAALGRLLDRVAPGAIAPGPR